jgi:hypothetical protein
VYLLEAGVGQVQKKAVLHVRVDGLLIQLGCVIGIHLGGVAVPIVVQLLTVLEQMVR